MSIDDFKLWLMQPKNYTLLVQIDTVEPKYLSYGGYIDPVSKIEYRGYISGGVSFSESITADGNPNISIGDIEIENKDGIIDSWLSEVFTNKKIRLYVGDSSWNFSDFQLVLEGVVADLKPSGLDSYSLVIKNKLELLNSPISEVVVGGSDVTKKDNLVPLTFGECHNIEPVLVNEGTHRYRFHTGNSERIIEVRDYGVPVSFNASLSTGEFTLNQSPSGTITVSAQGDKPSNTYTDTVVNIIKNIVQNYGRSNLRLTSNDLDNSQLTAFNTANPQPVGIYVNQKNNVLNVVQELAASIGAQVLFTKQGKLRVVKYDLPQTTGDFETIDTFNYELDSLKISSKSDVIAGYRLGYCKNWMYQPNLETGIPSAHKDLFAKEYLEVKSQDSTVANNYSLFAEPEIVNTLLLTTTDAQNECNRRLNLNKQPLVVFSMTCFAEMMLLELGQTVILKGERFGLESGKKGVVTSLQTNWVNKRVNVEVTVPWQ